MNAQSGSGSGRRVEDFTPYCEGDLDPTLNKKIRTLIDSDKDYLVYLDEDLYVEWTFICDSPAGFEDTANSIGHLETLSLTQLDETQREPFERCLGEAMARILGDHNEEKAHAALSQAQAYLKARGSENARVWYLGGAETATLCALLTGAILLLIWHMVPDPMWRSALEVLIGATMGSLGAFLSIAGRTEAIHFEPVAGPRIHKVEGATRVVVGIAAALFAALAIKADLLFGVSQRLSHPFLALLVACFAAGAVERLVPGLIGNLAKSLSAQTHDCVEKR
jgi:hypothetical protein